MPSYPGRPREFTYQRRRELLDHLGQGATLEEAARIVGVSVRTVQREARHNEFFHHDLHLAVYAAPIDPEKQVRRAARTHWRAAAWLLERTDPDRFAKRPPNSYSPETLMDISNWLIETALEATLPEHRSAVYGRMRAVADKAVAVVMPDQHDARRSLVGDLPHRPMPLSYHEVVKQLLVVDDRPTSELDLPGGPEGILPAAPATSELAAPPRRRAPCRDARRQTRRGPALDRPCRHEHRRPHSPRPREPAAKAAGGPPERARGRFSAPRVRPDGRRRVLSASG
jgi:hypothetical protein